MEKKGVLIVTANPPAHMEAEFNAWYDLEHLPERMAVPGFESGRRYVQFGLERRYLALYDLASIDVLQSAEYEAVSGDNATPWTKRIVAACRFRRDVATQVFPGDALSAVSPVLLFARIEGARSEELVDRLGKTQRETALPLRLFEGAGDSAGSHFLVGGGVGGSGTAFEPLSALQGVSIAMAGNYAPY